MTKTDSDHIASVNLNHGLSMEIMGGKHVYIQLLKCTRQDIAGNIEIYLGSYRRRSFQMPSSLD